MKINENKLSIKHLLEVYQELPGFPSHEDTEYCLVRTLEEKELLNSTFKAEHIWQGFKSMFGTISELRGFLEYLASPDDPKDYKTFKVQIKKAADSSAATDSYILHSHVWM
jgi:hypothetical protein